MKYDERPGTATPGQKRLGQGMENKLGAGYYSNWDLFSQREARDRNVMLLALRKCLFDMDMTILKMDGKYWWWNVDPNGPEPEWLKSFLNENR